MKATTTNFIGTIILALIFSLFLPWWSVMVAGFISAFFIPLKRSAVFFAPFLAVLLFWAIYSFMLSSGNEYTLAKRIAILLPLGGNPFLLLLVTGIVGGLAAGIAAIFGKQLNVVIKK